MAKTINLLLVDDNDVTAELYQTLLTQAGYEVLVTPDVSTGMQVLTGIEVDVVILDYESPDKVGQTWLQELRQHPRYKQTPVILVSTLHQEGAVQQDRYIWFMEKPKQPQHFVSAVQHTIDKFN